jgi:hypothetical protein
MNAHDPDLIKKETKLVPSQANKPPAKRQAAARKWQAVEKLVELADDLVEFSRDLDRGQVTVQGLDVKWVAHYAARCKAAVEQLDLREHYDDEDDDESEIKLEYVQNRLGCLIGSFPNAAPPSPTVFAETMAQHVAAIPNLSVLALETACREIATTMKFTPAIAEVVEVVTKHVEVWMPRYWAINGTEEARKRLLERAKRQEAEKQREAARFETEVARVNAENEWAAASMLCVQIERTRELLAQLISSHAAIVAKANALTEAAVKAEAEFATKYPQPVVAVLNGVGGLSCRAEIAPAAAA